MSDVESRKETKFACQGCGATELVDTSEMAKPDRQRYRDSCDNCDGLLTWVRLD